MQTGMNVNITGRTDGMKKGGVKTPRVAANMVKLALLMGRAGLTTKELSQMTGIGIKSLYDYQRGKYMPTRKGYNALAEVFGWEKEKPPERKKNTKRKYDVVRIVIEDAPRLPKPVKYEFSEGCMYRKSESAKKPEEDVLKYEGKQGIHHCFRAVRGGWTRTYTDAQLVVKQIKEVELEWK